MRVYLSDLRGIRGLSARSGLCHRGAREWFARHGLSWDDFRRDGIAVEDLLRVGDAFAQAAVEHVMKREAGDGK